VYGTQGNRTPREPCVVAFPAATLLYVTEADSSIGTNPGIAIGVAPGTAVLPPPDPM
jgi:hypothetical protein